MDGRHSESGGSGSPPDDFDGHSEVVRGGGAPNECNADGDSLFGPFFSEDAVQQEGLSTAPYAGQEGEIEGGSQIKMTSLTIEEGDEYKYAVYAVYDPRAPGCPVYIGFSENPAQRAHQHATDPASAVYHKMRDLEKIGIDLVMTPIARFADRDRALAFEKEKIATTWGIINRNVPACRKSLGLPVSAMWK